MKLATLFWWIDKRTHGEGRLAVALILAVVALLLIFATQALAAQDRIAMLRDTSIDGPRCEKQDLMLLPLQYSIAQRGDRILSWQLYCDYGVGKKPKPTKKHRRARRR